LYFGKVKPLESEEYWLTFRL